MNAPKFTPGPWWIGDPNCRLDGTREKGIHTVDYIIADMNADAGTDARQAADARLIAAAPELYAQLEFAVKLLGGLPGFAGTAQIESMRAALAKATQS